MKKSERQSRREFIRSISLITGTSFIASSLPWMNALANENPDQTLSPSDKVRIGIIGVGSRGSLLLLHMKNIPSIEIAAVCDNYPPHFDRAKEMTNNKAKAFVDYRKLLEINDIDAVVIATPLNEHAHITIDALQAGKHVFCEKSMARLPENCLAMVNTHRKTGKILQIGHQRMFNPKYIKAMEFIRAGQLGNITQMRAYWHRNNDWRRTVPSPELEKKINWRLYKEFSCGLMTELASHQIQVANWALGEFPNKIMGAGSINYWKDGREVHDNVNLVYTYPGGTQLIYDSCTSNKHYGLEEQIMGPKGTMELEAGKMFSETPPPAPGIMHLLNNIEHKVFDTIPLGGASWVPDSPSKNKGEYILDEDLEDDGTQLELEAFAYSVKENKIDPEYIRQAYYASIAALLGFNAIEEEKVIIVPENLKIV